MAGKLSLLVGFGAGYVLGSRAGRERYEQISSRARQLWQDPRVQEKAGQAQDLAKTKSGAAAAAVAEKASDAGAKVAAKATGKGRDDSGEAGASGQPDTGSVGGTRR